MPHRLIQFFREAAPGQRMTRILLASALAGIANAGVVIIINSAAKELSSFNWRYLALFALALAIFITTKRLALQMSIIGSQETLIDMNQRLATKVRQADLRSFEQIGPERVMADLTENSSLILEASRMATNAAASAVMLLASCIYIATLSPVALWLSIGLLFCGIYVYYFNERKISESLQQTGCAEREYQHILHHLTLGFTEVKMNRQRADSILEGALGSVLDRLKTLKCDTEKRFIDNMIFTQIFFYLLIGAIVFLLPRLESHDSQVIIQLVTMVLFIIGPLGSVVDAMPTFTKANMALHKIDELEDQLDASSEPHALVPAPQLKPDASFSTLVLRDLYFSYDNGSQSRAGFVLGPLNLEIRKGEILCIVGGNGSGKTTLLKLLTGLYRPLDGRIEIDGVSIDPDQYPHYRQLFSVIFTDFHLFDRLYGLENADDEQVRDWLEQLGIAANVHFNEGQFNYKGLSTGQKKRLALVSALLEDRPILVFDEVAADQDPHFRRHYYEVFLPLLRRQGKTLIIVSHDDRYFQIADRVLKMDYGAFSSTTDSR